MSEWMGEVSKVNERDWGSKKIYSWQFKGSAIWFRCAEDPQLVEGNHIAIEGDTPNKIERIEHVAPETIKKAAKEQTDVPPTSSPDYWRWKQIHDLERQAYFDWRDARADATRIVCTALDNDVLSLGQKKGLKLDILIGQIKETTLQLLERNNESDS